ncbi:MAG: carbamoyltransferase, partial [Acidobacteriota bacterium]
MYVLGVNYYDHDSSAVLLKDGEVLCAIAEERLSRIKKDHSFPRRSIRFCLEQAGIEYRDVDHVAFGWQKPGTSFRHDLKCFATGRLPLLSDYFVNSTRRYVRERHQQGGIKFLNREFGRHPREIFFVDHHFAHALSSYVMSGFEESAILILDGRGAWESTTLWRASGDEIRLAESYPFPNSLGFLYAAFTAYLGFRPNADEWKVMGLAPYGNRGVSLEKFISLNGGRYTIAQRRLMGRRNRDLTALIEEFGESRAPESEISGRHKDIAYAIQEVCEQSMLGLADRIVKRAGSRRLCMAGGVALNSKANGAILASGMIDEIFIQPASADDGTALGAALGVYARLGLPLPRQRMDHVYLGPGFSDAEIEAALRTYKLSYTRLEDPPRAAAEALAEGKIIGWFQGRMEFGPRALGNRSILADPRDPAMRDKVNAVAKFREGWRPFAPSVIEERGSEYFEGFRPSPFMILTFQVKPDKRREIAAVTHVDGSARVQSVRREVNPSYHDLIRAFGELTGVPVVMNCTAWSAFGICP